MKPRPFVQCAIAENLAGDDPILISIQKFAIYQSFSWQLEVLLQLSSLRGGKQNKWRPRLLKAERKGPSVVTAEASHETLSAASWLRRTSIRDLTDAFYPRWLRAAAASLLLPCVLSR